jgi:hypothetical protein
MNNGSMGKPERSKASHTRKKFRLVVSLCATVSVAAALAAPAESQSASAARDDSAPIASITAVRPGLIYIRPSEKTELHNYFFDAFGPYPIAGAALAAGVNQAYNTPPEWKQGLKGYSKRFSSDFAIAAVTTTTRYGLAQAFREDSLYYRCDCKGVIPRLSHAIISTFTARRGGNGQRVFSFPALVSPYVGTMTAVYGWYPGRFGAKDAFRMGNYSMLGYVGGNVALEFFYSGPHSLLSRMHLNNRHGAPDLTSKQ